MALRRSTTRTRRLRKKDDKRGKHTKASRELKRQEAQRFFDSIVSTLVCDNCSGNDFVPTDEGDATVCITCGLVSNTRLIEGTTDVLNEFNGSLPYKSRNYFAERLQQARNREPRFTTSEENKINCIWSMLHSKDRIEWSNKAASFSKDKFQSICRVLDEVEPGKRWKQQLERWWQARAVIYGEDRGWEILDEYHTFTLKVLFDPFAWYFSKFLKYDENGKKHNIPKIDLVILVLLYNISEEALVMYGWYFLSKNIVWPTRSTLEHYEKIEEIFDKCNQYFNSSSRKPEVRSQSYAWLRNHQFTVPDYKYLIYLALDSKEAKYVYNHLSTKSQNKKIQLVYPSRARVTIARFLITFPAHWAKWVCVHTTVLIVTLYS